MRQIIYIALFLLLAFVAAEYNFIDTETYTESYVDTSAFEFAQDEEDIMRAIIEELHEQDDEFEVDEAWIIAKAKCIFKCIGGRYTLNRIISVVRQCKKDLKCYLKIVGKDAFECAKQCIF